MAYDTALGAQLGRAGVHKLTLAQFVFDVLRETGGDKIQAARRLEAEIKRHESWLAELCQSYVAERAKDMSGSPLRRESGGQDAVAEEGHSCGAPTPAKLNVLKQDEAERLFDSVKTSSRTRASAREGLGHAASALESQANLAPSSRPVSATGAATNGGGHRQRAGNGQRTSAPTAPAPKRFTPGHARRGASQIKAVQATMHRSCLDTYTIRDGRIIGDVLYGELRSIRAQNLEEAYLLKRIEKHMANASPSQRVRDIITEQTLERYIGEAKELADAA